MIGITIGAISITVTITVTIAIAVTVIMIGFMLIEIQYITDVLYLPGPVFGIY